MTDEISFGWTGKILRVNLSTKQTSLHPTEPYKQYIGGMGLANKVMFDEVEPGTDPLSEKNKVVFAVGPLTASGVPLAGRTTICSLSTFTKDKLLVDAHCGGMIGAQIKLAGYDAIILEGKAAAPVYINIVNDLVEIKDATAYWGMGTREVSEALARVEGTRACVATIGPAGENLLPYSCIINSRNHSAGAGIGAVMGSKNCKALVVRGTGSVYVADPQAVAELSDYMLREIIGSNNNHVVPSTQQEWAEFYDEGSRWTARPGLTWGSAENGPIETGISVPGDLNSVGYRCMKSTFDIGEIAEKYTVKMNGCHGCPIHCHADIRVEHSSELGGFASGGNTCVANMSFKFLDAILKTDISKKPESFLLWNVVMGTTIDDLGLWCNYGQLYRDIGRCIKGGIFDRVLPEEEKALFDWNRIYEDDPRIIVELFTKIAQNDSEIAMVGHGTFAWTERWNDMDWYDNYASKMISRRGWPLHHANETYGQVGALANVMFNRDAMGHSTVNFQGCGLPFELLQEIAEEVWGGKDALDPAKHWSPMNESKANFAWWSIVTDVLHDSLTLCNWVWPMTMSPTKARNYRGDLDLESKFFKAVTGVDLSTDDLYTIGGKIMTLQRASTACGMTKADGSIGNNNFREDHDQITQWVFDMDPDLKPFSKGTIKLDRDDYQLALSMLYGKFGWDENLGCPTVGCLDAYDMPDVKERLASLKLLP